MSAVGYVRVGAHHSGNAAVQIPAHGLLFAGQLGVEIDESHFDSGGQRGEQRVGLSKRAVGRRHVDASLQIENGALDSVARFDDDDARSRQIPRSNSRDGAGAAAWAGNRKFRACPRCGCRW